MRRHVISAACGLGMLCSAPLQAEPVVVVEMFTSQGCVSCPPADAYFATLTQDPKIIPLSLHVDYWDYIGWSDIFGSPAFTERQKSYARAIGSRTIYTPQFVVGGRDRIEGFDPDEAYAAMARQLDDQALELARLRRTSEVLRDELQRLQEVAISGAVDPAQINRAMLAELNALRACRLSEMAELEEITALLEAHVGESAHA